VIMAADDLVIAAQRGSHSAFAELIRRYERTALGIAYAIVGDPHAAGDIVQDAFLRAWQRLASLEAPERFGVWFSGIVRNRATDHYRSMRRRDRRELSELPDVPSEHDPSGRMGRQETQVRLQTAVMRLDETSRTIVLLRYYEGLTGREIAEMLAMTIPAVEMRLSRARRELKLILEASSPELCPEIMPDAVPEDGTCGS
jgi:RNA polymerase sigma-70 factor (ECF subfamily)